MIRNLSLLLAALLSAVAAAALWVWFDRPVPVAESWEGPVSSVSFAPFRRGQSPLTKVYPTSQQIEQDLQSLVGRTRGVRTYTSEEGMEVVPDMAAKLGLKVIFSAWLTNETEAKGKKLNDAEIDGLIKAANAHPNEIERVIVGNEVLLRRDLKPEELIAYIRKVKAAVKQPVSYADVWAFYLKYPEVAKEVDFITIHILPFWEDEPEPIDNVDDYMVRIVERMREAFPGKPILIGEAGWPSIGRDRGPAVVNTVNEARFVRKMANIAANHGFDYNIVEAFDQPWKSALENTVGAAWGIMDIDRKAKFDMSGPVTEVLDWKLRGAVAIGAGILATLWFGRGISSLGGRLVFALLAQVLAWLAVTTCFHAEAVSFRWWQDLWAPLRGGLGIGFAVLGLIRAKTFIEDPKAVLAGTMPQPTVFGRKLGRGGVLTNGESLVILSGLYAIGWTLLLFIDGRYRDIPEIDFSVPAAVTLALLILRLVQTLRQGGTPAQALSFDGLFAALPVATQKRSSLVLWLGRGLLLCAVLAVASEGLAVMMGEDFAKDHPTLADQIPLILRGMIINREMVLWSVMQLVLAVPFLARRKG